MDKLTLAQRPVEAELADYRALYRGLFATEHALLGEALHHVMQRPGKQMRPILVLLTAKAFRGVTQQTLQCAAMLELLHTASLLHDDVVDESSERRAQPSLNAVHDNRIAILVGDYMLARALHLAALTGDVHIVDLVAGLGASLAAGEVKQIETARKADYSEEAYLQVVRHKTASLFATCTRFGAITGGATPEQTEKAVRLGEIIGICFQLRDDIFDYFDNARIGKPTGNDMAEGKLTLPALYAVAHTTSRNVRQWAAHVKQGTATQEEILDLIAYTKQAGGIDYARQRMESFRSEGTALLRDFAPGNVRDALQAYLDYTIVRDH